MSKTCQNCHDLKALKKELQKSYDNFNAMVESNSERENNLLSRIEEMEKELDYFGAAAKTCSTENYRLKCANESLLNQLESQPGLSTMQRLKDEVVSARKEQARLAMIAANAIRREHDLKMKMEALQASMDKAAKCSYCDCKMTCDCTNNLEKIGNG